MRTIFRGVAPFVIADLLLLSVLVLFPQISMWLPKALGH
jgi:C4-dicarboxylate transporter DctM subunit